MRKSSRAASEFSMIQNKLFDEHLLRYDEALEIGIEASGHCDKFLPQHAHTFKAHKLVALILGALGRYEECLEKCREIYQKGKERFAPNSTIISEALDFWKDCYTEFSQKLTSDRAIKENFLYDVAYKNHLKVLKSTEELFDAVRAKQKEFKIQELLENGAIVNAAFGDDGSTVLHSAAFNGDLAVMKALLKKKPDINAMDEDNWTPLHYAAQESHLEMVKLLLSHQANPLTQNSNGMTPLCLALQNYSRNPCTDRGIIRVLMKAVRDLGPRESTDLRFYR